MLESAAPPRRARRRRHLRLLRPGGGGVGPQRARRAVRSCGPTCSSATWRSSASRPTARSRRDARARSGCECHLHGRRAHIGAGLDGPQRDPPARARCSWRSIATSPASPMIDGCRFHEALQAVEIEAACRATSSPTASRSTVAHRFAPDRSAAEAEAHVREFLAPSPRGRRRASRSSTSRPPRRRRSTIRCWRRWSSATASRSGRSSAGPTSPASPQQRHPRGELRARRPDDRPHRPTSTSTRDSIERTWRCSTTCCRRDLTDVRRGSSVTAPTRSRDRSHRGRRP